MKKAFSLVLALMLVLSLGIVSLADTKTVNYEDLEYGLAVGGVVVTNANKNDIFGDGTAHYDSDYNTLYLNGAMLDYMTICMDGEPILGGVSIYAMRQDYGFEIVLAGDNSLAGDIQSATAVGIAGTDDGAKLTVNGWILCSYTHDDWYDNYSPLRFFGEHAVTLTVTDNLYYGYCDERGYFDPTKVPASDTGSVLNVNGVNNIEYNGIASSPKVYLTLGMTEVTFQNADDIFDNGKFGDGKASYDREKNTLYLNNAAIYGIGVTVSNEEGELLADDAAIYVCTRDIGFSIVATGNNKITGNIYSPTTVHISADQSGADLTVDGDIICTEEHEEKNYSPLALTGTKKVNLKVTGNLYYEGKVFDPRKVSTGYTGSSLEVHGVSYDKKWEFPERTHSHDFDGEKIVLDGIKESTTETNPDTGAPVGSVLFALPILAGAAFLLRKKH